MRRFAMVALLAAGCAEAVPDSGGAPVSVLDPVGLAPVAASADPLAAHRPAEISCPAGAWGAEGGGFEIQTGVCDYAAFDQALPWALQPGDTLEITVWHDRLDSVEPGTGHVAVWLGADVVWEAEVEIPAESSTLSGTVSIEAPLARGERLGVHLHNHGFNSWRFVDITVH